MEKKTKQPIDGAKNTSSNKDGESLTNGEGNPQTPLVSKSKKNTMVATASAAISPNNKPSNKKTLVSDAGSAKSLSEEGFSAESLPKKSASGESSVAKPASEKPSSAKSTPTKPASAKSALTKSASEKGASEKSALTKSATSKTTTSKPTRKKASLLETLGSRSLAARILAEKAEKPKEKSLIIVESPSKAHTIEKYLGAGYKVLASMGHLIDLPKSKLGVDTEHNFEPTYITIRGRAKVLNELQKAAKNAKQVLLASDNDREGEAIAWHLNNALAGKTQAPIKRIVFNEITPRAIREAVKNPGEIVTSKVNAQKARRILDRLVGYNLSPVLWKKVKGGLSAGRVQSVALRLICEREVEVNNFLPQEYWTVTGDFSKGTKHFGAELVKLSGAKLDIKSEADANKVIKALNGQNGKVLSVKETQKMIKPQPPFTTSKLQQAGANKLGFTSKRTMKVAQELYEGVRVGSSSIGLITYMRTDSVRVSDVALQSVRDWLAKNYSDFLPPSANIYTVGKSAQDAHEGIRPTYVEYTPESIKKYLTPDQYKLYSIIWERFVASQMTAALSTTQTVELEVKDAVFRVAVSKIKTPGFYAVMKLLAGKEEKSGKALPLLHEGDEVTLNKLSGEQHFTQGPARYTDASIVKTLEEKGIGRPSTYAPIISVLLDRYYVTRVNKALKPTTLGVIINKILVESFPAVINETFTREFEEKLDLIEEDKLSWVDEIGKFYKPFKAHLDEVMGSIESVKGTFDEATNLVCEKCGRPIVKRLGRFGFFYACSGFPECRNAKSIPLAKCPMPDCDGNIIERKTKARGKKFYGCTNYPKCSFITYSKPIAATCPKCGWFLVEKYTKKDGTFKSCINPACNYLHTADDEVAK